jgi:hypothetical protein
VLELAERVGSRSVTTDMSGWARFDQSPQEVAEHLVVDVRHLSPLPSVSAGFSSSWFTNVVSPVAVDAGAAAWL